MTTQTNKTTLTKNRPTISQIFFSLTFLLSLWYFKKGFSEWATVYLLFYWTWLTYVTGKSVRHPKTNKYGKSLADTNTILSLLTVFGVLFILLLSASFLARIIFGFSGFYSIVLYGLLIAFILSVVGHIYIAIKNILTINNNQDKIKLIFGLIIYPFGIWTVQETLKTNETEK
jgi:hypothetical protein